MTTKTVNDREVTTDQMTWFQDNTEELSRKEEAGGRRKVVVENPEQSQSERACGNS